MAAPADDGKVTPSEMRMAMLRLASDLRAIQADPAWKARTGYVENVRKARHASLVGRRHAEAVVKAIDFVMKAAA